MLWFTADTHFYHRNIIDYCNRPYATVQEMNEDIVNRWNNSVSSADTVYFIGDFGLGPASKLGDIRQRLNGKITLIKGNHDRSISDKRWKNDVGMDDVVDWADLDEFKLMHLPYKEDDKEFFQINKEKWLLCGHVHTKWRIKERQFNVGMDVNGFKPISINEIREIIKQEGYGAQTP